MSKAADGKSTEGEVAGGTMQHKGWIQWKCKYSTGIRTKHTAHKTNLIIKHKRLQTNNHVKTF